MFHSKSYEMNRSENVLSLFLHMKNTRLRGTGWLCPRPRYWKVAEKEPRLSLFDSLDEMHFLLFVSSFSNLRVGGYHVYPSDGIYLSVLMTWGPLHWGHMFEELISQERRLEGVTTRSCLGISGMDYLVGSNLQHKCQRTDCWVFKECKGSRFGLFKL